MVKQGQRSKQIIKMKPTHISEITEGKYDKFIIKFGASYCPPCKMMAEFLNTQSIPLQNDVPIYIIQLDEDQEEIAKALSEVIEFNSIPYCVVSNKSFEVIDSIEGFNKNSFIAFIEKNFR
jgi:thiol-disulfide isomerase/thioredoxin